MENMTNEQNDKKKITEHFDNHMVYTRESQ
jgi:hypothetical protein